MPSREVAVCKRLRAVRIALVWSQPDFAKALGIDVSSLQNIENARSPLRWVLAEKIFQVLGLNLDWLANGRGDPDAGRDWAPLNRNRFNERTLFTAVYDDQVSHQLLLKMGALRKRSVGAEYFDPRWRMNVLDMLSGHLFDCLCQVDDGHVSDFWDEIAVKALRITEKFSDKDAARIKRRRAAMMELEEEFAAKALYRIKLNKDEALRALKKEL